MHLPDPDRPLEANAAVDDYGKVRLGLGRPEYEPIEPERCRFSVSPTVDRDTRGRDICLTIDQARARLRVRGRDRLRRRLWVIG